MKKVVVIMIMAIMGVTAFYFWPDITGTVSYDPLFLMGFAFGSAFILTFLFRILFESESSSDICGVVIEKCKNEYLKIEMDNKRVKTIIVPKDVYDNTFVYSYYGSNLEHIKPKDKKPKPEWVKMFWDESKGK